MNDKPWKLLTSNEKIERLSLTVATLCWLVVFLTALVAVLAVRSFS